MRPTLRGIVVRRFSLRVRLAVFTGSLLVIACVVLTLFLILTAKQQVEASSLIGLVVVVLFCGLLVLDGRHRIAPAYRHDVAPPATLVRLRSTPDLMLTNLMTNCARWPTR